MKQNYEAQTGLDKIVTTEKKVSVKENKSILLTICLT